MRRTALGVLLLAATTVACSLEPAPEAFEDPIAPRRTKTTEPSPTDETIPTTPSGSDSGEPAPSVPTTPALAADVTWTGTLAATSATTFGGAPSCTYRVRLENVKVTVTTAVDGAVKSAVVDADAVEEGLDGCPNAPIPPNAHAYRFDPAAPAAASFAVMGAATNVPSARMDAQLSDGRITLTWHRVDIDAPFDWTIAADVALEKQ